MNATARRPSVYQDAPCAVTRGADAGAGTDAFDESELREAARVHHVLDEECLALRPRRDAEPARVVDCRDETAAARAADLRDEHGLPWKRSGASHARTHVGGAPPCAYLRRTMSGRRP